MRFIDKKLNNIVRKDFMLKFNIFFMSKYIKFAKCI